MVSSKDYITKQELIMAMADRAKDETDKRHADRNKLSEGLFIIDELKTDGALMKQSQSTMANDIKETKETCEKILNKIDTFHATFVTKEEHKIAHTANEKKIEKIENILGKINWIIISSVILGLLALIIKMK